VAAREEVTRPELLDSIQEMKAEIRRYEDHYDDGVTGGTRPATLDGGGETGLGRPDGVAHDAAESRRRTSRTRLR